jgi:DNA-binding SARP family transcriptional activator
VVPIRRGLPRTILVALVLRHGHTVPSDFLVELLWGDELPRNPANALQIQVSYLRKTLGSADPSGAGVLETRAGGYALVVDPEQIDAYRFEAASRVFPPLPAVRSATELRSALDEVDRALALWRGDALEDVADMEFAGGEIARLDELRWLATERRTDVLLRLGRHGDTLGELAELVRQMPLRERFHEQLVLALYRSGRQADALRAYGQARRTLVEELGIDPGVDLRDLERRILDQDPALEWVAPQEPAPAAVVTAVEPSPPPRRTSGRLPVPVSALVGREEQITRLEHLLERNRAVTLTGPAGAGKTRLAIEVAARHRQQSCYVDFSPIDDPGLVAPTVAAAAGVTIAPGDDPVTAIADTLASRELLVVLDTCEHVVTAAAQLASTVLHTAAMSAATASVISRSGATAVARSMNSATAAWEVISPAPSASGGGRSNGGTGQATSPDTPSGRRLVATIRTPGAVCNTADAT